MERRLRLNLLGTFRLTVHGRSVLSGDWQKRKARSLVQILALQRSKSLHRDALVEMLFPEADLHAANENFYRAVYAARHALQPDLSTGDRANFLSQDGKQFFLAQPENVWTDAEEFERASRDALRKNDYENLESAEAIYTGDLLAYEPVEDWMLEPREHFSGIYHRVVRRLADMAEAARETVSAHHWLDKLIVRDAADEAAHRAKMRLFCSAGDRTLALRQYEACKAALRHELDVEPEPETESLRQKIIKNGRPGG